MFWLQVLNAIILVAAWFSMRKAPGYNHYDPETGEANDPSEYDNAHGSDPVVYNAVILSFYLFAPFWALYFVMGGVLAFIYGETSLQVGTSLSTFAFRLTCCRYPPDGQYNSTQMPTSLQSATMPTFGGMLLTVAPLLCLGLLLPLSFSQCTTILMRKGGSGE